MRSRLDSTRRPGPLRGVGSAVMTDIDGPFEEDDPYEVEDYGTEDEPAYHIKVENETLADVIWHRVENRDPDVVKAGYWMIAYADGSQEDLREIPDDDHDQAIDYAKSRLDDA